MSKRILVIAPHSDDAELGLGGYIHKAASKGDQVDVAVLATGAVRSTHSGHAVGIGTRSKEGHKAGKVLGVHRYDFAEVALDAGFNAVHRGDFVQAVERLIFETWHDELFIPLPSFHEDHVVTYEACVAALRPHLNRPLPGAIYAYEYPGQCWGPPNALNGRVYCSLAAENLQAKLNALALHQSQWASTSRSLYGERGVRALAELRGAEIGVEAAECFYLMRAVTL